jgi:hypothetical protein
MASGFLCANRGNIDPIWPIVVVLALARTKWSVVEKNRGAFFNTVKLVASPSTIVATCCWTDRAFWSAVMASIGE